MGEGIVHAIYRNVGQILKRIVSSEELHPDELDA